MPYADKEKNSAVIRAWHQEHPEERREHRKRERYKLKRACLLAYSVTDPPSCACCRETEEVFLTLDHIEGGGNADRRSRGHKGGTQAYRELKREGFPPGFRVLCWNCNFAYHLLGVCPHQTEKEDAA